MLNVDRKEWTSQENPNIHEIINIHETYEALTGKPKYSGYKICMNLNVPKALIRPTIGVSHHGQCILSP